MGLAVEIEGALSYGGLFSSPGNLHEATTWLASEQRRNGLLSQTARLAEKAHGAHGAAPHLVALEDSNAKLAWLKQLVSDLTAHNARIADMEFPIGEYIAEPIAYFTGGWKKWFEKK
jgi:hypothetical protein